ncbi:MAG: exo-alpha-sialidase [Thermoplasmata archaeon]|nr:exo-alpha-sialidase [Thermoplasmata archaeon]
MAKSNTVRVYLGTRKGAYVVESDTRRRKWKMFGPFHEGRDVFHVAPDPRSPGHVYSAVNSGFFGPMIFRSTDGGHKWKEIGTPLMEKGAKRKPNFDPSSSPFPIVNLWHIQPGPAEEPKSVFLGVDPASLYRSDDRGDTWTGLPGLNEHPTRPKWNPGAGGMCLHTIILDPTNPRRMYIGISAAGTFRSDNGGESWRPVNKGVKVSFSPEKYPEFGQCVHHVAIDAADPSTFYRQDHDGIYVSHDAMESWKHVGQSLDTDFGFGVTSPASMPGNAFFLPLNGGTRVTTEGGLQVYRWNEKSRTFSPTVRGRPWPGEFGAHREGMASDGLDPAGIYVGTTTGQLFVSADGAKSWDLVPYWFPSIHSVSVASPPSG